MLSLLSLTLLFSISAAHYGDYGYGYNKYNIGYKKVEPYGYGGHYGGHQQYGKPYGHGWGQGWPMPRPYQRSYVIYKRLPPIYKDVKQPVIIEQPVIIRKIPVFHKKKEVTVEKQPPIYDIKPDHKVMDGVGEEVGGKPMPDIHMPTEMGGGDGYKGYRGKDMMPEYGYEDQAMSGGGGGRRSIYKESAYGSDGMAGGEGEGKKEMVNMEGKGMMDEMPEYMSGGRRSIYKESAYGGDEGKEEGVDMEAKEGMEDKEEMEGKDSVEEKDMMEDKEVKEEMMDKDVMEEVMNKKPVESGAGGDDGFGDFNPKDFDESKKKKK